MGLGFRQRSSSLVLHVLPLIVAVELLARYAAISSKNPQARFCFCAPPPAKLLQRQGPLLLLMPLLLPPRKNDDDRAKLPSFTGMKNCASACMASLATVVVPG